MANNFPLLRMLKRFYAAQGNADWFPADTVVVDIQPAANYFYQGTTQEHWNVAEDFPSLAPPFRNFYIEHASPAWINSNGVHKSTDASGYVGALVMSIDAYEQGGEAEKRFREKGWRWQVNFYIFSGEEGKIFALKTRDKQLTAVVGILTIMVGPDGTVNENDVLAAVHDGLPADRIEAVRQACLTGMFPGMFAISLMHCKNVSLEECVTERQPRAGHRRHAPAIVHRTLNISPMRKTLDRAGASSPTGLKNAMHICRGHFKTFGGKGLFGRHQGTYWWAAQVRGDPNAGTVTKDYRVKPE